MTKDNVIEILEGYQKDVGCSLLDDIGEECVFTTYDDHRIQDVKHILDQLIERAKSAGVPESQINWFNSQIKEIYNDENGSFNYDFSRFDTVVNGLCSLIKTYESVPTEIRAAVQSMSPEAQNDIC